MVSTGHPVNGRPISPLDTALADCRRIWGDHAEITVIDDPDEMTWLVVVHISDVRVDSRYVTRKRITDV